MRETEIRNEKWQQVSSMRFIGKKIQNILSDYSNRKILRLVCNERDKLRSQSNSEKCDKKLINCSDGEIKDSASRCLASLDNFRTAVHLQINTSTTMNVNFKHQNSSCKNMINIGAASD